MAPRILEAGWVTLVRAQALSLSPGTGWGGLTDDPVVEVVWEHPLTHGDQQPEGFLLLGVQQQDGRQDIHGLLGDSQGGALLSRLHRPTKTLKTHKPT